MYPNQTLTRPRYEFLVQPRVESEIKEISEEILTETIEKWLGHFNEEYKFAQIYASNRIQPSVSYWLQPETTFLYRDLQIMKGAPAGQLKPVRVITNEEQRKFFFGLRVVSVK